ncbi:hypothetical protein T11_2270 [Trichinella zimbabwensis]|uniref:Uncharacterized protein n=1 Tax=Trichinella zimbabwensis TaxID=268475 RepID=A0A0V1GPK9_9BILA|nr:hypothetical protein T11_2270 [Trichinella zimbabwensis]
MFAWEKSAPGDKVLVFRGEEAARGRKKAIKVDRVKDGSKRWKGCGCGENGVVAEKKGKETARCKNGASEVVKVKAALG